MDYLLQSERKPRVDYKAIDEAEPAFQIGYWKERFRIEVERSKVLAEQHQFMCLKYNALLLKLENSYPLPVHGQDDVDFPTGLEPF
jgi:hypothetical protein